MVFGVSGPTVGLESADSKICFSQEQLGDIGVATSAGRAVSSRKPLPAQNYFPTTSHVETFVAHRPTFESESKEWTLFQGRCKSLSPATTHF